jgi:hypothetical protein
MGSPFEACNLPPESPLGSPMRDTTDLAALQGQVVHWSFVIEDEAYDWIADSVGVDRACDTEGDQGTGTVDADLPPIRAAEVGKGSLGHEQDDERSCLCTELKPQRGRYAIIVGDRPATHEQGALAVFTAYSRTSWRF